MKLQEKNYICRSLQIVISIATDFSEREAVSCVCTNRPCALRSNISSNNVVRKCERGTHTLCVETYCSSKSERLNNIENKIEDAQKDSL